MIQAQRGISSGICLALFCLVNGLPFNTLAHTTVTTAQGWKVTEETLENGLTVLLLEDHRAPAVSLQVWYKVGSRNERLGMTGISHLLEHLMFRGTPKYGPGEFSQLVQSTGGMDNAFTTDDYTVYFENTAAPRIDLLIDLEADRMVNLNLDETDFQAERKIVMEERRLRTADEPAADLLEQVSAAAYTAHPYGWPVVGWMSDLEALTLDDVKQYRHTYYAPNNAILVIAGDVNPDTLLPKIREAFGNAPAGPPPPPVTAKEPPQRGERRVILKRPASLPIYMAAYHVPNFTEKDSFPLAMLSVILAGGRSSRLQTILVEKKALALSADADYDRTSRDPPLFILSMRIAPGKKWQDAEAALYQEVERLKTTPVGDKELQRAQNLVEASFTYGQDSLFFRAQQLGQYAALGDWKMIDQVIPGIRAVTAADVQRVAQTYLREENRTVGLLLPEGAPLREKPEEDLSSRAVH
ncbi:MAG TPA: pitrilysin family protein [Methylomirabilota bacterium]|jgi:zinc protease|nr:pitrilysin family protein [Methylomirabilota bacterium]